MKSQTEWIRSIVTIVTNFTVLKGDFLIQKYFFIQLDGAHTIVLCVGPIVFCYCIILYVGYVRVLSSFF